MTVGAYILTISSKNLQSSSSSFSGSYKEACITFVEKGHYVLRYLEVKRLAELSKPSSGIADGSAGVLSCKW